MNKKIVIYFWCIFTILVSLTGCIENSQQKEDKAGVSDEKENSMDYSDTPKEERGNLSTTTIKTSEQDITVLYAGKEFIKSVFAVGEDLLYVYGIKDDGDCFLGLMPDDGEVFQEFTVDTEEGMRAFNMVVNWNVVSREYGLLY